MGRFFVVLVLVLAVALQVRRRGREALEAMQEQRLRDEEALRSRYRLQQQLAREAEIDKRVQERLAARDAEARGLEKGLGRKEVPTAAEVAAEEPVPPGAERGPTKEPFPLPGKHKKHNKDKKEKKKKRRCEASDRQAILDGDGPGDNDDSDDLFGGGSPSKPSGLAPAM
ncbi:unnamed protein product, partial [Symbiodinium microadriaticum]